MNEEANIKEIAEVMFCEEIKLKWYQVIYLYMILIPLDFIFLIINIIKVKIMENNYGKRK